MVVDDQQPDRVAQGAFSPEARSRGARRPRRRLTPQPPPGWPAGSPRAPSPSRLGLDLQGAGEAVEPLPHRGEAEAALGLRVGRDRARLAHRRLEPDAVVPHVERHLVAHVGQRQDHAARARMPGHVGERLLGRAQKRDLDLRAHRARRAGRGDLRRHPAERRPAPGHLGQRLGQAGALERLRAQRPHRAAGLREALAREGRRGVKVPAPLLVGSAAPDPRPGVG